jgi:transposase
MTEQGRRVIGGVDAHADTHHVAALDDRGALLATKSFEVSAAGYLQLLAWLRGFGEVDRVGVESTGSYAAGLTRHLVGAGVRVLEINQPHAHTRRRRGKTDAIDAEIAARHALSLATAVIPKQTTGIVEAIRQLRVARDGAVKPRSAAMLQLGDLILTAPSELREQLAPRRTLKGDPVHAAKLALRSLARRIALLDDEIAELDTQLAPLVAAAAPRTTALLGISTGHAGQLLLTAGQNIDRLRSESAFAALCGASPIPVASGKRGRYRRALRRQPDTRRLRQARSLPPEPGRRPPSQPRPAPHRRLPPALLPRYPRLRPTPHHGGQDQQGDHALPQALHRPRGLRHPPRRSQIHRAHLTSIGTSRPG